MRRASLILLAVAALLVVRTGVAEEIEIGAKAPDFTAIDTEGESHNLKSKLKENKAVVVTFTCNACPVAVAYEDRFVEFNKKYKDKGVAFVALNCNNASEGLEQMKQRAEEKGFNFPYAFDASGEAARQYGARVTPHIFVVDSDGKVAYRGSFDDNQNESKVKNDYLADAVDAVLAGKTPEVASTKAFGCGIKLKKDKK